MCCQTQFMASRVTFYWATLYLFHGTIYVEGMTFFSYECAVKLHYSVEFLYAENNFTELRVKRGGIQQIM